MTHVCIRHFVCEIDNYRLSQQKQQTILPVINTLLRHLRLSIDRKVDDEAQRIKETKFEENIINTIGTVC
jgi:hypothetical protein